ncbi:class I adenylate-forming enzyme family protein [Nocardia sp. NPDC051030]|uniref:class I adenylate-forming enzyme family protein n=1 Tax=Nocardia sp. NPDC051030 TaxID=3155162 RepID=UPI003438FA10
MPRRNPRVFRHFGAIFDDFAADRRHTFEADRPFDLAPHRGTRWQVADLAELVATTAGALAQFPFRGERRKVAIVKRNHLDFILLASAVARGGGLPLMISGANTPQAISELLAKFEPDLIILSADQMPGLRPTLRASYSAVPQVILGADDIAVPGTSERMFADLDASPLPLCEQPDPDAPMVCTHTSGTTGTPKIIVHSTRTGLHAQSAMESMRGAFWRAGRKDVYASSTAFNHIRNLSWITAQLRCAPKLSFMLTDPSPENMVRHFARVAPTMVEAHPNDFQLWTDAARTHPEAFARTRFFMSTFDAIHPHTVQALLGASGRRFPIWGQGWAQSETGPIAVDFYFRRTFTTKRGLDRVKTLHGIPAPGVKIKIADEHGTDKQPGEVGMVYVRTGARCLDYLSESERHRLKADTDGWWCTGDLGQRISLGRIRLIDREVDAMPGGSTISTESELLHRIPEAVEIVVLATGDGLPQPVVSLRSGGELPELHWERAVADLPPLRAPIYLDWANVPKTATMKVRRSALREQLGAGYVGVGQGLWT